MQKPADRSIACKGGGGGAGWGGPKIRTGQEDQGGKVGSARVFEGGLGMGGWMGGGDRGLIAERKRELSANFTCLSNRG